MSTKRITRPISRNVIVEVVFPTSNLVMPEHIKNMSDKDFVVVARGEACERDFKVGDIIEVSSNFNGMPTSDGRKHHFICHETDIQGVVDLLINEEA